MSPLDGLPPDQRAVLQLVLQQARSYEDLARVLGISSDAVRARAHAGLQALGPDTGRRLPAERRALVSDYLLGQLPFSEREEAREQLIGSASARAWARVLSDELEPIARDGLPKIPEPEPDPEWAHADEEPPPEQRAPARRRARPAREPEEHDADGRARGRRLDPSDESDASVAGTGSSRLGGALLLAGLAILGVALIILLFSGGDKGKGSNTAGKTPPQTAAGGGATQPNTVEEATLKPPQGVPGGASGLVQLVVQQNGQQQLAGLLLRATKLPALGKNEFFGLWLAKSPTNVKFIVPIRAAQIKKGSVVGLAQAPTDYRSYPAAVLTRQPFTRSTAPPTKLGQIVLEGAFAAPKGR
jgi:hypothetical protein